MQTGNILLDASSTDVRNALGISPVVAQKAAKNGESINLEITFDREVIDEEMTMDARFKNYYGIDIYRQWLQMNTKYGKRIKT